MFTFQVHNGSLLNQIFAAYLSKFPSVEKPVAPSVPISYDYYISTLGSDTNDGSEGSPFASLQKISTLFNARVGGTKNVLIKTGTYNVGFRSTVDKAILSTLNIFVEEGAIFDMLNDTATYKESFMDVGYINNVVNIVGLGAGFTIQNTYNNAIGTSNEAICRLWNFNIINCYDGLTSHFNSQIWAINGTIAECGKSAIQHTGVGSKCYHYDLIVRVKVGAVLTGSMKIESGCYGYFNNCKFLPNVSDLGINVISIDDGAEGLFEACHLGKFGLVGVNLSSYSSVYNTKFRGCYFSTQAQFYKNTLIERCYGQFTLRPRGTDDNDITIKNCTFTGAYQSGYFCFFDFYSSPSSIGGIIKASGNSFVNYTWVWYANTTDKQTQASKWTISDNNYYNCTTPYTGITGLNDSYENSGITAASSDYSDYVSELKQGIGK